MAAPVTTSTLSMSSFFSTTLSAGISSSDTVIPLNAVPTGTEGFLVIDQDNSSKEIIYYNTKGGSSVTVPNVSTGRGQGGTTAVSHLSGATVKLNLVDQYWSELQNGNALKAGAVANTALAANTAWTSWTPTLTNLTLGNGTVVAKYQQIGKTVKFRFEFTLGSTSAVATSPTFSLPVTAANMNSYDMIGRAALNQTGTRQYLGFVNISTTTTANITAEAADTVFLYAASVTATSPFAWGSTHIITAFGTYEAA